MARSPWHIAHSAMRDRNALKGTSVDRGLMRRVWQFARPYRGMVLAFLGRNRVAVLLQSGSKMDRPSDIQGLMNTAFPRDDC